MKMLKERQINDKSRVTTYLKNHLICYEPTMYQAYEGSRSTLS